MSMTTSETAERYVIAIDGGTTNTRARLVRVPSFTIIASERKAVGARDTGAQGVATLERAVAEAVQAVIRQAGIRTEQVIGLVASGMVTSDAGLMNVPHLVAPAGLPELAAGMASRLFPEIWPEPILFVPGVKTLAATDRPLTLADAALCDVMRGEEAETLGLLKVAGLKPPAVLILPGSHTKMLLVDEAGRIVVSTTTVAGELASAVTSGTLLARSLGSGKLTAVDKQAAAEGFDTARTYGLGRSLFTIRLLDILAQTSLDQRISFLWGALIASDIAALEAHPSLGPIATGERGAVKIIIGGSEPLRSLFGKLFERWAADRPGVTVLVPDPETLEIASTVGATLVALESGRWQGKER